jgi:hypothetical protein
MAMKRKSILIFILLLIILCSFHFKSGNQSIVGKLEMCVTDSKQFGKLISIRVRLKNNSGENIYVDGCRFPPVTLLKRQPTGLFTDYTEKWPFDIFNKDLGKISSAMGKDTTYVPTFSEELGKFTDPNVQIFFKKFLQQRADAIKSKNDSIVIKKWIEMQFEYLAYIKKHDEYVDIRSLEVLPRGVYKLFLNYSNKERDMLQFQDHAKYDYLNLKMPESFNGYTRWRGEIKSDTLFLQIN